MKLTSSESIKCVKRALRLHGLTNAQVLSMLDENRKTGRDIPKLKAFSDTYQKLLEQAQVSKTECRGDKASKVLAKTFKEASSERRYKEFLAQVKATERSYAENSAWIRRCFFGGKSLSQSQMVALMSYSNQSGMKPTDPGWLEATNGCDEPSLVRAASIFCKRFGF